MATSKRRGFSFGSRSSVPEPAPEPAVSEASQPAEQAPYLKVLKGNPTDEELAALVVAVALTEANAEKTDAGAFSAMQRTLLRRQRLGAGLRPGAGSWRRARPQ